MSEFTQDVGDLISDLGTGGVLLITGMVAFVVITMLLLLASGVPSTGLCVKSHTTVITVGKIPVYTSHCDITATPRPR